ncbi:MAG: SLC26A/SulP transporter family protein [Xenococcaceae cyanobacterium]
MPLNWLKFQFLLPNLLAGLVAGAMNIIFSVTLAALIFPGDLSDYLSLGLSCAFISAILTPLIIALTSSLPFAISCPDVNTALILALVTTSISQYFTEKEVKTDILPTLVYVIVLSTLFIGLWLFVLGRLHLGHFIRFIPYPVVGGFLAGLGWLFIQGSLKVMTGSPFNFEQLDKFLGDDFIFLWFPGMLLAVVLQLLLSRYKQFWVMPSILLGATVLCYLFLFLSHIGVEQGRIEGILFESLKSDIILEPYVLFDLQQVDWGALSQQIPSLMTLLVVVPITILLKDSGLEIATECDVDFDRELKITGIANLVTGGVGGMVGHISLSRTLLNYKAGGRNRLSGVFAAFVCLLFWLFGTSTLQFFPKFIFGGLLFYLGLSLLIESVYKGWFKLSRLDYALVILILIIVANFGLLAGVGLGLIVACLLFVITYSNLQVIKNTLSGLTCHSNFERAFHQKKILRKEGRQIYILRLQGYLFFGTSNSLLENIRQRLSDTQLPPMKFVLLDLRLVSGLDNSAVLSFVKLKQLARQQGFSLVFTSLSSKDEQQLHKGGCLMRDSICQVFSDLDRGLEWCENCILDQQITTVSDSFSLLEQLETMFPNAEEMNKLTTYLQPVKLKAGELLFRQGEPSNGLYLLESGQVSVILELSGRKTKRLRSYNSSTILGEMGLYAKEPRSASVVAEVTSHLYHLSTEAFARIEAEEPRLAASLHKFIVNLLAERLKWREEELRGLLE